jgi:transcriptional regulator with XRE-family HTH domain
VPRESIEERQARLRPGARWLRAQREQRGISQTEFAQQLGASQDRISAYERAQDEPPADFIRSLAEVFEMSELEVWRSLGKALPREVVTDEAAATYAWTHRPDVMKKMGRIYGFGPPPNRRPTVVRDRDVARPGDAPCTASYG